MLTTRTLVKFGKLLAVQRQRLITEYAITSNVPNAWVIIPVEIVFRSVYNVGAYSNDQVVYIIVQICQAGYVVLNECAMWNRFDYRQDARKRMMQIVLNLDVVEKHNLTEQLLFSTRRRLTRFFRA